MAMNVKKGDTVIVLSGKDKGKQGKVLGTVPSEAKVVVEGANPRDVAQAQLRNLGAAR